MYTKIKDVVMKLIVSSIIALDLAIESLSKAVEYLEEVLYGKEHLDPPDKSDLIPEELQPYLTRNGLEDFGELVLEGIDKKKYYSVYEMKTKMPNPWSAVFCVKEEMLDFGWDGDDIARDLYYGEVTEEEAVEIGPETCRELVGYYKDYKRLMADAHALIPRIDRFIRLHRDAHNYLHEITRKMDDLLTFKKEVFQALGLKANKGCYGVVPTGTGTKFYEVYIDSDKFWLYLESDKKEIPPDMKQLFSLEDLQDLNSECVDYDVTPSLDEAMRVLNDVVHNKPVEVK